VKDFKDEADHLRDGTADPDPKAGTRVVAAKVPRVLTLQDIMRKSREQAFSRDEARVLTTGHYKLDRFTGGFRKGFTWLLGADTSFGKTSFLVAIADENLRQGKRVLIVSGEDPDVLYGDRFMVRRSRVNAMRYRDRRMTRDELAAVLEAESKAEPLPVYVDASGWKIEDLAPHLETIVREHKIDLVAYDYIQELTSKRRFQDERVKFKEIAAVCRQVAKRSNIAGLILSQLTFNSEGKSKVPNRHNIRECRDIANASEVILIGFEPETDIKDPKEDRVLVPAGTKCMLVDKVKNGPRGSKVPLVWNEDGAFFEAVKDPEQDAFDRQASEYENWTKDFAEDGAAERYP
jgi:replicative DNA helicase